jgi:hypothetical protein
MLDGVARQIVKNRQLKEKNFHAENIIPDVQRLLESQDDLMPLWKLALVDPLAYQVDPLVLSLETTSLNRKDQIQCLWTDYIELDSEGASIIGRAMPGCRWLDENSCWDIEHDALQL